MIVDYFSMIALNSKSVFLDAEFRVDNRNLARLQIKKRKIFDGFEKTKLNLAVSVWHNLTCTTY